MANGSFITKRRLQRLRQSLFAFGLIPTDGQGPRELEGGDGERAMRDVLRVKGRVEGRRWEPIRTMGDDKHDVVLKAPDERNTGYEVKVLNNVNQKERAVLMRLHPQDHVGLEPSDSAEELAVKVLRAAGEKIKASSASHKVCDSRISFFYRDRASGDFLYWEEPFYPHEINPNHLVWRKRGDSLAGEAGGRIVLEYFWKNGQLRYQPQPPAGALVIPRPQESLEMDDIRDMLVQTYLRKRAEAAAAPFS